VELRDTFSVPATPDVVWELLVDIARVVPLMPGAELTEVVDARTWKGRVHARLGPVKLVFGGSVEFEDRDDAQRRAVLRVRASEVRGKGVAHARVISQVAAVAEGTRVDLFTDLSLSGAIAQYGSGIIGDVAKRMTEDFAKQMAAFLRGEFDAAAGPTPIRGLSVAADALARGAMRRIRGTDRETTSD
jgi:uncharacterized protein